MAQSNPPLTPNPNVVRDYAKHNDALRAYFDGHLIPPPGVQANPLPCPKCDGRMYKWQETCGDCQEQARARRRAESEAWHDSVVRNRMGR